MSAGTRPMRRYCVTSILAAAVLIAPAAGSGQSQPERPVVTRQVTVRAITPGEVPADFNARFTGPRAVQLSWKAPPGATDFAIMRAASSAGPWTQVGTAAATATTYSDASAMPSARYAYRVTARYTDRLPASTPAADVVMPCDRYCVNGDCSPVARPSTKLGVEEGTSGAGAQFRFTLKVTAVDAATGAPVTGTVTVSDVTRPVGALIAYKPCRAGNVDNLDAEIVPCRARINLTGRGEMRIVTAR